MNGNDAAAWVSALGALLGAVAAIAAWRSAAASARVSRELMVIEAARRRQELTPIVVWRIDPTGSGNKFFHLTLELEGPLPLQKLGCLTVKIRDDRPGRAEESLSLNGSPLSQEQIRRQVWGPLQFSPGVGPGSDRADADGRVIDVTAPVMVGEGLRFQLEPTRNPWHWRSDAGVADAEWMAMVGTRLRLTVTAFAEEGDPDPWTLPSEIAVPGLGVAESG